MIVAVIAIGIFLVISMIIYYIMKNRDVDKYDFEKNKDQYMRSQLK